MDQNLSLNEQLETLPRSPGCYLFKNSSGVVLYVGKAKILRNRVLQYFHQGPKGAKTELLTRQIADIELRTTANEVEAYILENQLIKELAPKYNIQLRDDKTYPFVLISKTEKFPRLEYRRRFKRTKNILVYGPFVTGSSVREILSLLTKCFLLRDCSDHEFKGRKTPCLLYQIHQCSAPCVDYIDSRDYRGLLDPVIDFFSGRPEKVLSTLYKEMMDKSENLEFERAAFLRDSIQRLKEFVPFIREDDQSEVQAKKNLDVIYFEQSPYAIYVVIGVTRKGLFLGHKFFKVDKIFSNPNEHHDDLLAVLGQYYQQGAISGPSAIYIDLPTKEGAFFKEALESLLLGPDNKEQVIPELFFKINKLDESSQLHCLKTIEFGKEKVGSERKKSEQNLAAHLELKELLKLDSTPKSIECFDVAIWQGQAPTASQVTFTHGHPDKKKYRMYHLKERKEGNNDFAMMAETFERRLKRKDFPDIFLIDGGLGQINIVGRLLAEKGIDIPVIGIAKSRFKSQSDWGDREKWERTHERLFIPGRKNEVNLSRRPQLLKLLTALRDEAHRFSRKLHHKKMEKGRFTFWFDQIKGIGPKSRKQILKNLDCSPEDLKGLSLEQLQEKFQLTSIQTKNMWNYLKKMSN